MGWRNDIRLEVLDFLRLANVYFYKVNEAKNEQIPPTEQELLELEVRLKRIRKLMFGG